MNKSSSLIIHNISTYLNSDLVTVFDTVYKDFIQCENLIILSASLKFLKTMHAGTEHSLATFPFSITCSTILNATLNLSSSLVNLSIENSLTLPNTSILYGLILNQDIPKDTVFWINGVFTL